MFDPGSRYERTETATRSESDGRVVVYVRRRFLPQGDELPLLVEVKVGQGDRLDLIAGRTLGDPTHSWRVCDANNAMDPADLTAEIGRTLRVPLPQP